MNKDDMWVSQVPADSEVTKRALATTGQDIAMFIKETECILERAGYTDVLHQAQEWHKVHTLHVAKDFANTPTILHQALQWAMLAMTSIHTYQAVVDYTNFQAEMLKAEEEGTI